MPSSKKQGNFGKKPAISLRHATDWSIFLPGQSQGTYDHPTMRSFIRHPTDIPIEVRFEEQACNREPLRNVSRGGLCFQHPQAISVGTKILVRIALTSPPFEACCRVTWCQADIGSWQVGVEFLDQEDLFRARMVEQICHIEHYRRAMREEQGRILSGHEAALEWIEKHAGAFPHPDETTKPPHDK